VEAATFCALMTLYDALHHEACVDVYTVSKLYCMKRPGVWPTEVRFHPSSHIAYEMTHQQQCSTCVTATGSELMPLWVVDCLVPCLTQRITRNEDNNTKK